MLPVPFFGQREGTCGPASLRMVLAYHGIDLGESEAEALTGVDEHGVEGERLAQVARSFGLQATIQEGATIEDLRALVMKGIPPIVAWFSHDTGHYSVVIDVNADHLTLLDPEEGRRTFLHEDFLSVWFDYGGAYPASKEDFSLQSFLAISRDAAEADTD